MATRKQIEDSFLRIQRLVGKLQSELLRAQRNEISEVVPSDKYRELSPLQPFYEMDSRIKAVFKNPIAEAVMDDLRTKARKR